MARIIRASSAPGGMILDCFAGSGTTLDVAHELGRNWIGIDNSLYAIDTILQRLAYGTKPMGDFVSKRENQELKQTTLFDEVAEESGQERNEASNSQTYRIPDFSLLSSVEITSELDDSLSNWLESTGWPLAFK